LALFSEKKKSENQELIADFSDENSNFLKEKNPSEGGSIFGSFISENDLANLKTQKIVGDFGTKINTTVKRIVQILTQEEESKVIFLFSFFFIFFFLFFFIFFYFIFIYFFFFLFFIFSFYLFLFF
jgi:ABC-type multidrug transport system permease subunit